MEGDKKRSKGGLFHLFDWNGKSRKKLFSNNSEVSEVPKQGNENVESVAKLRLYMAEVDERTMNSSVKGSSDFSCASSMTSDEEHGTKAPGVVARLMGLDSLPTSNVCDPASTPFLHSGYLKGFQYDGSTSNFWSEYNSVDYLNVPNEQGSYSCNFIEPRLHKVPNRPIDRFQTEVLPPQSAKPIPITRHKLLSPIKNPRFIQTKNVAYIVEAAAKIIEASPKAVTSPRVPSISSSSVPLRIQDLKQKIEVSHTESKPQRSKEQRAGRNTRGQCNDKTHSRLEGMSSCKGSKFLEKSVSESSRNKGKQVSLAVQAKANVQRREGSTSRSNNNTKQKEQNEARSNQQSKIQPSARKIVQKRTSEIRTSNALRQNNHKQNCISHKDSSISKGSVSNQKGNRVQSMSGSIGPSRLNRVIVKPELLSQKMGSAATDSAKEKIKTVRKKRSINGDIECDRSPNNVVSNKADGCIEGNVGIDGSLKKAIDGTKNAMDVISFTFTSPMTRAMPNPQACSQLLGKSNSSLSDLPSGDNRPYLGNIISSFPRLNVVGGDALGALLEQKLRELTNKVELSHSNVIREEISRSSASSVQYPLPTLYMNTSSEAQDSMLVGLEKDMSDQFDDVDCISAEDSLSAANQQWQQSEETEQRSRSSYTESVKELEGRHPSPVSILEVSFAEGSWSSTSGTKYCSPSKDQDFLSGICTNESIQLDCETELSDTASSISTFDLGRKHVTRTMTTYEFKEPNNWEMDYVKCILNKAELMLADFAMDQTPKVISPNFFDQLETQENALETSVEDYHTKLGRKVLFDCVGGCLDFRCGQAFAKSGKAWAKLLRLFQRKGLLAEVLYREINGWKSMGDLMVDELVDKDMSTQYGKWLDFEIEAYEEGVEIENGIISSLVDELVSDLLPL